MRRWLVVAGIMLALLGSTTAALAPGRSARAVSLAPVFAHPVTVDAQRFVAEPDLAIGSDDRFYVSGPWGVTTNTTFFWRSEDAGTHFRQIQAAPGFQNPLPFRGGGDTEIAVGSPAAVGKPNRLYFADQDNLDSNTCGYSDDAGRSFNFASGAVCPETVGADRQWLAHTRVDPTVAANGGLLDHDITYLWYDHFGSGNTIYRSDDGLTYGNPVSFPVGGNPGNAVADPNTGVLYFTVPTAGGAALGWSADGGKTLNSVLPFKAGVVAGNTATDFSVLSMDSSGNLYLVVSNQAVPGRPWQTWIVRSTGFRTVNNGTRNVPVAGASPLMWSDPVPITGPGSSRPDITYSVFPWVVAGDPGRVAVAFYGTNQPLTYDPSSMPARWTTYVSEAIDFTGAGPNFYTSPVSEAPSHLDSICFNGIGCTGQGNRNLLDFFEIQKDVQGAAVVVYNDDANTLTAAFPGGPLVMVGKQVGGPSLFASVGELGGAPLPDTHAVTDREGTGMLPTSDVNVPDLDLVGAGAELTAPTNLRVTFKVNSLSGGVASLPPVGATGITYLLTWKYKDDLWYAAAHENGVGTFIYDAGRPQSVPFTLTGGPKFAGYTLNPNSTQVAGTVDRTARTITIDVPTSAVGNVDAHSRLLQVTGFTLADRGATALADQADQTRSFDDFLGVIPATTTQAGPTPAPAPAPSPTSAPLPNTAPTGSRSLSLLVPVAAVALAFVTAMTTRRIRSGRGGRP